MEHDPQVVWCPKCELQGTRNSLGSLTMQGNLIIRKRANRETMIIASSFVVVCDCGYTIQINNGRIQETTLSTFMSE